ncbi:MAG: hypothetical protein V1896_00305 [Candidatus Zambryskibacteria bacterium]
MFKKPLFPEMLVLFLIVGILHVIATVNHLYWSIYEFDSLVHFIGGVALSLLFVWLYFFSDYFNPSKRSLARFLLISVLGAMFVAVSWETYELIFKQTMVAKANYPFDLTMDLMMDFLGAIAGCFYAYIREYNRQIVLKNINESR